MHAFSLDCDDGKGDATACQSAGEFYSIVEGNHTRAAEIFRKNCDAKHYPSSCFNYATQLITGQGVDQQDLKGAYTRLDKACDRDHAPACELLGRLLLRGDGCKQDPKRAAKHLEYACNEGLPGACHRLAAILLRAEKPEVSEDGTQRKYAKNLPKRSPVKALPLLETGCRHRHAPSCFNLARLYKNGDAGVPSDAAKFNEIDGQLQELVRQRGGKMEGVGTNL